MHAGKLWCVISLYYLHAQSLLLLMDKAHHSYPKNHDDAKLGPLYNCRIISNQRMWTRLMKLLCIYFDKVNNEKYDMSSSQFKEIDKAE